MSLAFKLVTLSDPFFSLPALDEGSFRDVLRFADYLGRRGKVSVYRLNLDKCASLDPADLGRLARYGVHLSDDVVREIDKLRLTRLVRVSLKGSDLVVTATPSVKSLLPGYALWEPRTRTYRVKPYKLWDLLESLKGKCTLNVDLDLEMRLSFEPKPGFKLRGYQAKCYDAWRRNGFRGVISLPTAAGKTFLALQALADLKVKALILVPSIELLHQWRRAICRYLNAPLDKVGVYGGGFKEVKDVTVATYQSACLNAEALAGCFMLMVADEAHHAVAEEFRRGLELSVAKYRMGLTGTPLRSDGLHKHYEEVLGPLIQAVSEEELRQRGYIAGYKVKRLYVDLDPQSMEEYQRYVKAYNEYCDEVMPKVRDPRKRFKLCLKYAARDPRARSALRARSRARSLALNADRKIELVGQLLSKYGDKKVLIFSRYVDVVREVSKRYLIPLIVAETSNDERKALLEMFRRGEVTKLASGMTLEEGVDVPDAQVGIIVSGSGSNREYLQRIGRLLRPKSEKALVVELITKGTLDQQLSIRRRRFREWAVEE